MTLPFEPAHLAIATGAALPPGLAWVLSECDGAPCLELRTPAGCSATVWRNEALGDGELPERFTWHTWDDEGVGGENAVDELLEDALDEAWKALVREGWATETDTAVPIVDLSRRFFFRATHQVPGDPAHEDAFELVLTVRGPLVEGKVLDLGKLAAAGVDLRKEPLVGVGTVCRRQGTGVATLIMRSLASGGLRLHGFGFKMQGLQACHRNLESADSLAWSFAARRDPPLPGHDQPGDGRRTGHINCANCPDYALAWRATLLDSLGDDGPGMGGGGSQIGLWAGATA